MTDRCPVCGSAPVLGFADSDPNRPLDQEPRPAVPAALDERKEVPTDAELATANNGGPVAAAALERLVKGINAAVTLWLIGGDTDQRYTPTEVATEVHRIAWEQHDRLASEYAALSESSDARPAVPAALDVERLREAIRNTLYRVETRTDFNRGDRPTTAEPMEVWSETNIERIAREYSALSESSDD